MGHISYILATEALESAYVLWCFEYDTPHVFHLSNSSSLITKSHCYYKIDVTDVLTIRQPRSSCDSHIPR